MKKKNLIRAAQRFNLITGNRGQYGLTVWCLPSYSGRSTAVYSTESAGLNYSVFRETTVGQIRGAGYDMTQSGKPGHYTLELPSPPTEADWQTIDDIFGDPQPIIEVNEGGD